MNRLCNIFPWLCLLGFYVRESGLKKYRMLFCKLYRYRFFLLLFWLVGLVFFFVCLFLWHLSFLVFSKLLESVVCCLTLEEILVIASNIAFVPFSLYSLGIPITCMLHHL